MATSFRQRQLYGGAVVADLPANFLDASDLRQIPDHQEVFLSPTTLTSIIFEINEYQTTSAVEVHSNIRRVRSNDSSYNLEEDEAASTHHFLDLVVPPDTVDPDSITRNPPRVVLSDPSVSHFPAYTQSGTIVGAGGNSLRRTSTSTSTSGPPHHQQIPSPSRLQSSTTTRVYQLLVRLKKYDTDLCIRVNVPLDELRSGNTASELARARGAAGALNQEIEGGDGDGDGDGHEEWKITNELAFAETALEEVIQSLRIVNFELFSA